VLLFILSVIFTAAYNGPRVNFIAALVNVQEDDACEKALEAVDDVLNEHDEEIRKAMEEDQNKYEPAHSDYHEAENALIDAVAAADPDFAKAKNAVEAACGDSEPALFRGSISSAAVGKCECAFSLSLITV
jgi:hypothetical protein